MRKGQFLGVPIVFMGLIVLALVIVVGLFLFFSGFLDKAATWITGNLASAWEFLLDLFSFS